MLWFKNLKKNSLTNKNIQYKHAIKMYKTIKQFYMLKELILKYQKNANFRFTLI